MKLKRILIISFIIISIAFIIYEMMCIADPYLWRKIIYNSEKKQGLTYLERKYDGYKFKIISIVKDPYDGTYISEVEALKSGYLPFEFQLRMHNGAFSENYILEQVICQNEKIDLFNLISKHQFGLKLQEVSVYRYNFRDYGIDETNYLKKEEIIKKIPITVSIDFKDNKNIDEHEFINIALEVRNLLLKNYNRFEKLWISYNQPDCNDVFSLEIGKNDFYSSKEILEQKLFIHPHYKGIQ